MPKTCATQVINSPPHFSSHPSHQSNLISSNLNVLTVYRNPGGVLLIVIGSLVLLVTGFIRYNEYHYDLYRKSTEDVRFLDDGEYSSLIYLELVQTLTLLFL